MEASGRGRRPTGLPLRPRCRGGDPVKGTREPRTSRRRGACRRARVYDRYALRPGMRSSRDRRWSRSANRPRSSAPATELERRRGPQPRGRHRDSGRRRDDASSTPSALGIYWDRLIAITDEILSALVRTSFSTNVRESYDLSCMLFDADGRSIAQGTYSVPSFTGTAPRDGAPRCWRSSRPTRCSRATCSPPTTRGSAPATSSTSTCCARSSAGRLVGYCLSHHAPAGHRRHRLLRDGAARSTRRASVSRSSSWSRRANPTASSSSWSPTNVRVPEQTLGRHPGERHLHRSGGASARRVHGRVRARRSDDRSPIDRRDHRARDARPDPRDPRRHLRATASRSRGGTRRSRSRRGSTIAGDARPGSISTAPAASCPRASTCRSRYSARLRRLRDQVHHRAASAEQHGLRPADHGDGAAQLHPQRPAALIRPAGATSIGHFVTPLVFGALADGASRSRPGRFRHAEPGATARAASRRPRRLQHLLLVGRLRRPRRSGRRADDAVSLEHDRGADRGVGGPHLHDLRAEGAAPGLGWTGSRARRASARRS